MPETALPAGTTATQEAGITAALGARSIVLVGMMGAGKSTIGCGLSLRLRLPFLDADTEIEAAAGMSIPDIFESHGEPHFRDGEARVIARLLDNGPAVLATGGGCRSEIAAAPATAIPDISESHGEPHFRDGEARVIARLLDNGPAVLATGGGAFMREETRRRILAPGGSILLKGD